VAVRVQLKKVRDGKPSLACVRAHGSRTWSTVHPFFPLHDLTHCAVERVFGFDEAFFGLIASGWGIDAFAEPGANARMPVQAMVTECMVGLLDLERGTSQPMSGAEFTAALAASLAGQGLQAFRPVGDGELAEVRALRGTLSARWHALGPGETLELIFPAEGASS